MLGYDYNAEVVQMEKEMETESEAGFDKEIPDPNNTDEGINKNGQE